MLTDRINFFSSPSSSSFTITIIIRFNSHFFFFFWYSYAKKTQIFTNYDDVNFFSFSLKIEPKITKEEKSHHSNQDFFFLVWSCKIQKKNCKNQHKSNDDKVWRNFIIIINIIIVKTKTKTKRKKKFLFLDKNIKKMNFYLWIFWWWWWSSSSQSTTNIHRCCLVYNLKIILIVENKKMPKQNNIDLIWPIIIIIIHWGFFVQSLINLFFSYICFWLFGFFSNYICVQINNKWWNLLLLSDYCCC